MTDSNMDIFNDIINQTSQYEDKNKMNIDWNILSSIATAIGSLATAIGVIFGAWQIRLSKKQSQAAFEDHFDQQYRELTMEIPVDVLIGKVPQKEDEMRVRELIYNYLDLTNEQVYLRAKGRISKLTWVSWSSGIKAHLERPAFKRVFEEIKTNSNFTYLEKLVSQDYQADPKSWY
ncbi:hypothetical protein [Aliikangiella coralliicola]|uniref:DUF4760 domain-containing protein n=1 Tax=Aliikangiella coralliicola TaxID=2592383 RepID=A0A545UFP9_9GAMM|nr:hypothetical protein [Aliikangiella coralliicola]TQV88213.1 hypothetical protein FLL46_06715 [Aliikangiella coralliicola]